MYWKNTGKNTRTLDNFGIPNSQGSIGGSSGEFYEMELGLVLDIVLDDKHPIFTGGDKYHSKIDPERWPADLENKPPISTDIDYSWIGRALIRPLVSEQITEKDQLSWAYPLEANISQYPLINETVILINQGCLLYTSDAADE